jgi:hypothetical protein
MTFPKPPKDFPLSQDWWLSMSAVRPKTLYDVVEALDMQDEPAVIQAAAVETYYEEHPERKQYVTPAVRQEMKKYGFMVTF